MTQGFFEWHKDYSKDGIHPKNVNDVLEEILFLM